MKPGDKSFWKISRSLRGKGKNVLPALIHGSSKIITDSGKADLLADVFFKFNYITVGYKHSIDASINSEIARFKLESPFAELILPTSISEISGLIANLKSSKSPGFDEISNLLLKRLPEKALKVIVTIFNSCLRFNYFPQSFKVAKVIAIPKPNKPSSDPSSYRPISLLSNISKLFEKIIHSRLYEFATENSLISPAQFGFRREHSAVHQVHRIKKIIENNKQMRRSTGLVLLDIEKAFDTIWHNGLIHKLLKNDVPKYLCKIILDFLESRSFIVTVNQSRSSPKLLNTGLPQGSVLSPLLYSIYTADFKAPSFVKTAYYADDTALITTSKLTTALLKKMETGLLACNKYFSKWKIKINPNKTQAIIFPFNKSPKRLPIRKLNFGTERIDIADSVKYLGVTLDKKLNFGKHIDEVCKKTLRTIRSLWPLIHKKSTLNYANKNLLFKSVIRPSLTYGCPVWYRTAKSHWKKLQILQNKCLKIINRRHWRYSTALLHDETGYEKLDTFVDRLNDNYFNKVKYSTYQLIRSCNELT